MPLKSARFKCSPNKPWRSKPACMEAPLCLLDTSSERSLMEFAPQGERWASNTCAGPLKRPGARRESVGVVPETQVFEEAENALQFVLQTPPIAVLFRDGRPLELAL